jgi:hypothetical protein
LTLPAEPDLHTPELEAQLRALAPAAEPAYRWVYRENSPHCRRYPTWQARIAEPQGMRDMDGHAKAFTRATELRRTLTGKP